MFNFQRFDHEQFKLHITLFLNNTYSYQILIFETIDFHVTFSKFPLAQINSTT